MRRLLLLLGAAAEMDDDMRAAVLGHGPWPPALRADPSNRVSGQPAAVALGQVLFFDAGLSPDGRFSCASCHAPGRGYADGRAVGQGRVALARNTIGLANVRFWRWFGWDGGEDTLWGQSLRPILDPNEMAASPGHVAAHVRGSAELACRYRAAFGAEPGDERAVVVDVAKALAAFQETLVTAPAPFDAFRDALARGDAAGMAAYPASARRGLGIFLGAGQCAACHAGPLFSNREFHDAGVPYFLPGGGVDAGRATGIARWRHSAFGLLGAWNDDPAGSDLRASRHAVAQPRNFGEFRVPSLRGLAGTAPYQHAGGRPDLASVVDYYSDLDEARLHADGERLLAPLRLPPAARADLVAFLESLQGALPALRTPAPCTE